MFTLAVSGFSQRFSREEDAGSGLARAGTGRDIYSYSLEPALSCTSQSRQVESFPFRAEARKKFAKESFAQGVSWEVTGYPSFGLQLERERF
jgi:hypothetical protein